MTSLRWYERSPCLSPHAVETRESAQKLPWVCSLPRRFSWTQRKMAHKGRRKGENKRVSSSSFPCPLRLVNSLSRFALSHEVPEEERYLSVDHFVQMGSSPFLVRSARKARRIFGSITSQLENLFFHPPLYLAHLHMSPVYRDCPVSDISPCLAVKIFRYEHFSPVTLINYGDLDCILLHCLLYFPHHKHPIQLQWYNFRSY